MVKKVSTRINVEGSNINVLADVLDTLRFRGSIFFRSKLAAPWGMSLQKMQNPRFHIALSGDCYIGVNHNEIINIKHMDIVLIPAGEMHWIADQPGRELTPSEQAGDACELGMPLFQSGEITNKLICGLINYDKDILHPILNAFPPALHLSNIKQNDPIWMTVMLIDAEMEKEEINQASIIDRLTEVLFMQLLNKYMSENEEVTGFFAALNDKRIYRVFESIHNNPEYPWTLDLLVEQANMSRATLIRHFKETVGVPPITYIINWRMTKAYHLIKYSTNTIEQIADMVGFSSARTLAKSFKQHYGFTPHELRCKK